MQALDFSFDNVDPSLGFDFMAQIDNWYNTDLSTGLQPDVDMDAFAATQEHGLAHSSTGATLGSGPVSARTMDPTFAPSITGGWPTSQGSQQVPNQRGPIAMGGFAHSLGSQVASHSAPFVGATAPSIRIMGWQPTVNEVVLRGLGILPFEHAAATNTPTWESWPREGLQVSGSHVADFRALASETSMDVSLAGPEVTQGFHATTLAGAPAHASFGFPGLAQSDSAPQTVMGLGLIVPQPSTGVPDAPSVAAPLAADLTDAELLALLSESDMQELIRASSESLPSIGSNDSMVEDQAGRADPSVSAADKVVDGNAPPSNGADTEERPSVLAPWPDAAKEYFASIEGECAMMGSLAEARARNPSSNPSPVDSSPKSSSTATGSTKLATPTSSPTTLPTKKSGYQKIKPPPRVVHAQQFLSPWHHLFDPIRADELCSQHTDFTSSLGSRPASASEPVRYDDVMKLSLLPPHSKEAKVA